MVDTNQNGAAVSGRVEDNKELDDMIAEADTGGRHPKNQIVYKFLFYTALTWSIFQLYVSSPLVLEFTPWMHESMVKEFHLAFSIFLAYLSFPALKSSPRDFIPIQDWIWAIIAASCCFYLIVMSEALSDRPGNPTQLDVVVATIGVVMLLEATRRALGPPLMIVALVFLVYTFAGPYMPDVIAHKGASLNKGASHYWLFTEGVFGVAIGVSATMVFLFVLFGSLLEQAGAGNYFIRVAFAMMGHFRGGPAKAAVVSSALTGMISGSSIANVVTTGTFTIPLMKKVGFSPEKAGAVEVASSTNGQLTPPIMGAAAFLMVEYVGIPYIDVIKHAFLPAVISYIALVYIVHLEAMKLGMEGLPRVHKMAGKAKLLGFLSVVIILSTLVWVLPPAVAMIKSVTGEITLYAFAVILAVSYLGLLFISSRVPDLPHDDMTVLPEVGPTVKAGFHYLLPVLVLVWLLTVERLSPGLSAFWAAVFMVFVIVTQKPLLALFRGSGGEEIQKIKEGLIDLEYGLVAGARNMIGIGVATAAAGIIVGTITLTGIGQVMVEFVELISGGNLMLILLFTALISLILGMGLPTTANYIVVSSLMAPVIVTLGAQAGLVVPLIAAHMFVFYFGILADDTPPVGLAAFAAAAISKGDPIKTGLQGFMYDIRTAILPFLFIFNTELLMIGITGPVHLIMTIVVAVTAMLVFAAATQGFFIAKSRLWESLILVLVAFTLFRPGYWMDQIYPPLIEKPGSELFATVEAMPEGDQLKIRIKGEDLSGNAVDKVVSLTMGAPGTGAERVANLGIELRQGEDKTIVDNVGFDSPAQKAGIDFDFEITNILAKADRPAKQLFYIPAFILLGLIILLQRSRRRVELAEQAT
ncbi:MAG: TRAP transporter permease [Rhodospirillales bacterium]|nr:TRAP transporter permease [Rhodospirillales bacterium]